jgi:hypothetical protein
MLVIILRILLIRKCICLLLLILVITLLFHYGHVLVFKLVMEQVVLRYGFANKINNHVTSTLFKIMTIMWPSSF